MKFLKVVVTFIYENTSLVPPGIYSLEIEDGVINADGCDRIVNTYNGSYPGPKIEACWGDALRINVTNRLKNMGTTVHWHGYADGLAGPLLVYGPSSEIWETTPEPIMIGDWVHGSAFDEFVNEKSLSRGLAKTDSIVVNGIGNDPQNATRVKQYSVTPFEPKKRHRLRLINASAGTSYVVSIDGHNMTVIASDFVSFKPFTVSSLVIGIGQRYTVIVQGLDDPLAGGSNGKYWIRTHPADGCNTFRTGNFDSKSSPSEIFDVRTAYIQYSTAANDTAVLNVQLSNAPCNRACVDITMRLEPFVSWQIPETPLNNITESRFLPAFQNVNDSTLGHAGNYTHWMLRLPPDMEHAAAGREFHRPLWLDFGKPTLLDPAAAIADLNYNAVNYTTYPMNEGYVFMIIDARILALNGSTMFPVAHPVHWHGSDVVILGPNTTEFDPETSPSTFIYDNPPHRDVVIIPAGGWVAVAFRPDNPGAWLVHCHIAWHASSGLALQMIVQGDDILDAMGQDAIDNIRDECKIWEDDVAKGGILEQDDSGV
ncbi:multicopper oxidase-domain-containing protein [Coniochaeta sp. 2T2.1]|nr:multicopper oxidase-domain-containing protein [Coniochaeta sp. 2T2.1]